MLRDLLSSRLIQAGLVFFVLCVGGSLLYSWHVKRTTEVSDLRKRRQPVESQPENTVPRNTAPVDFQTEGSVDTSDESTDTQKLESTAALENETETDDLADAFLPDDLVSEEEVQSDFPEVPEGFPMTPLWNDDRFPNYQKGDMQEHETLYRVLIKLWNQGDHEFINGVLDHNNGRVYPLYPDTLYVTWKEEVVDTPEGPRTIRVPGTVVGTHDRHFTPEELYFFGVEASYPEVNFC